ncbi:MAG: ABC transporter permease [Acidobacteriaceae bacterium]|nr:ABC transporter permease [Acidobacteriaceae bacterium]
MLRFIFRTWRRTPTFTIAALVCLALGIGATTAIFSIVNGVILRPLPYPNPDRLVRIYTEFPTFPNGGLHKFWVSEPEVFDLKRAAHSFEEIGAWGTVGANLSGSVRPIRVNATFISADLARLLEVKPMMGHLPTAEDDVPGAPPVEDLSLGVRQRDFAGDPHVVGRHTYLNNTSATVIGVMPKGFLFPPDAIDQTDIWSALQLDPKSTNRGGHNYNVIGRLRPGVTLQQARSEMARLVAGWSAYASPNYHSFDTKSHPVSMYSYHAEVTGAVRKPMLMLLGAVVFVLLIACMNVANLLLARSEARQREIAVRQAVGASTRQLLKQFITEGALLALLGGALGTVLASFALQLVEQTNPGSLPRANEIRMDVSVLVFTLVVSLATGVLFGLAPFLHVSAIRVFDALKTASGRTSSSLKSNRFRRVLVVTQVAMAFLLIAGAGLMIRGFWNLQQVNPGFNPRGIVTFTLNLPQATYKDNTARAKFWTALQDRLATIPGAQSATMALGLPPIRRENDNDTQIEGYVRVPNGPLENVQYYQCAGDRFFETLGARLVEGRFLEPRDGDVRTPGVVVNASMARTFWPHESAIGHRVRPFGAPGWMSVVGVIADIKNAGLDKPAATELFLPYRLYAMSTPVVLIRTTGDPFNVLAAARMVVASLDPSLPIAEVRTMDEVMTAANARPRFLTIILGLFSGLALTLATVGIYGLISYAVEQRTAEFGIKLALGAEPVQVLLQIVANGFLLAIVGIGLGVAGAAVLTRFLQGLLFEVSRFDPLSFVGTALVLSSAAVLASFMPAVRAMRIDPVRALRYE